MRLFLERLWKLAKPYRGRLFAGILAGIVAGLMEPIMIGTVSVVYGVIFPTEASKIAPHGASGIGHTIPLIAHAQEEIEIFRKHLTEQLSHQGKGAIFALIALIPLVLLIRGIVGYLNTYFLSWVSVKAVTDLRSNLFEHLLSLPIGFFNRASSGELVSRVATDTYFLHSILSQTAAVVVRDPVTLLCFATWLLIGYTKITLTAIIVMPLCLLPIIIYSRKVRKSSGAIQSYFARLMEIMTETFTGNRVIKSYGLEHTMQKRFRDSASKYVSAQLRVIRALEIPGPLMEFFGAVGVSLVLLAMQLGKIPPLKGEDFILVIGSIFSMYKPIKQITRLHSQLEQARSATERVFELLAEKSDLPDPVVPKTVTGRGADIVFEHVGFSYGDKPALVDFNLTVPAGKMVALVGKSGSGKTTAANLLLRFFDPQSGHIRIGGVELREAATAQLRSQMAIVTQDVVLFNDTVKANIRLGRVEATDDEVVQAATAAYAHDFIMSKEKGYDTEVGEKGVLLSGGQRQRLAIARALVRNAPILILDEATSALDTESERAVQNAFEKLMEGRTTLVIAHRLSTIQRADIIVVMEHGRIVELGTHAELLARGMTYAQLHALGDAAFSGT
ncbi:MAG TPA: ABC transporter transmembrane domain-containing protein [Candidatus Limnocylindria bacterium]|jgi:subfamily B ATP-binding cassette protein MsbA|nr:ABC transporter transmembrane domain-containing protein [Candidatus Limnocylindria bacterium]